MTKWTLKRVRRCGDRPGYIAVERGALRLYCGWNLCRWALIADVEWFSGPVHWYVMMSILCLGIEVHGGRGWLSRERSAERGK